MDIDTKIRELFTKLEARKASVAELRSHVDKSWKTNCTFRLIGASATTNIQTAPREVVEEVATHLQILVTSRVDASRRLNTTFSENIQGYPVSAWFDDLRKRLAAIDIREQEQQLSQLETRLNQLLSPEERRRIEVELLAREL